MRRVVPVLAACALLLHAGPALSGPARTLNVIFEEGLHSDDGTVQDRAIALLKEVAQPSHVPRLRKLLKEGEERLAVLAIEYLVKFKDRSSVPMLIKVAEDLGNTISERSKAIWALGEFNAKQHASRLLDVLEVAVRTNKRLLARTTISTLATFNARQALPKLLELYDNQFKRKDYQAHLEPAILSLGGREHLEAIQKNNVSGQYAGLTLQGIATFDRPLAIEEFFKHEEAMLWREDVGGFSGFVSISCDVSCLRMLRKKAQSVGALHPNFYRELAALVTRLGDAGHGRFLYPALRNEDSSVRVAAAESLAALGGSKNARQLEMAFDNERNVEIKTALAEALAKVGSAEALSAFAKGLRAGDDVARKSVIEALVNAETPLAMRAMADALGARQPKVRGDAAAGLGRTGDPLAGEELLAALGKERHDGVKATMTQALGALHYQPALGKILRFTGKRSPKALRIAALLAAAEIGGKPIYGPVSKLVRDKRFVKDTDNPKLKAAAYRALGASGHPGAFKPLKEVLDKYPALSWEFPASVRAAACDALGKLENKKGVSVLLQLQGKLKERDRKEIGDAIVRGLAGIGGKKADRYVLEVADSVTFNLNAYKALAGTTRFRDRAAEGLARYYLQTDLTTAPEVEAFVLDFLTGYLAPAKKADKAKARKKKRRGKKRRRR